MTVSLSQLRRNVRTINVAYFENNLAVTYRPSELTPQNTSEIQDKIDNGEAKNVIIETLCRVMVSWDLVDTELDEEGNPLLDMEGNNKTVPFPITPESLNTLPGPLLLAISDAIGEDARPKPKSAGKSFAR